MSLHICPVTIRNEESIHFIDKCHTKQMKLENHFILITDGRRHHVLLNCLLTTCLPGLPNLSCTNVSLPQLGSDILLQPIYTTMSNSAYLQPQILLDGMHDTLTCGCNSHQAYTTCTLAMQAL